MTRTTPSEAPSRSGLVCLGGKAVALSRLSPTSSINSSTNRHTPPRHVCQSLSGAEFLFQAALDEFEKKSGINLGLQRSRGDHGKLMTWINRIVNILHTLSTNNILVGGVGLAFPPAKAVISGIAILLSPCDMLDYYKKTKGVIASYDPILDLFESFESFLGRLDVYTKIPSTAAIAEIVVKILIELLSTISLAIQHVRQGRLKRFGKKLLGENEIEMVLKRLDRLTLEEARMSATQTLEVVYGLVKNMKVVMDDGTLLMDDIHRALGMLFSE
ncbi:hypothetical protein BC827DRAFT_1157651 [Russula dissimulans]|nr:hypothetical protein BC827DRAFT_1157651 [Russula dissimulans]